MAGRWTDEDRQLLWELRGQVSISEAAERLGRSEYAIRSYLKRKSIPWGRWARKSRKREQIELIRQRNIVLRAMAYFKRMKKNGAVISIVEIVKAAGAQATIRRGGVVACPDQDLLDEAASRAGYRRHTVPNPKFRKVGKNDKALIYKPKP